MEKKIRGKEKNRQESVVFLCKGAVCEQTEDLNPPPLPAPQNCGGRGSSRSFCGTGSPLTP